jgi:hypothetical protein
MHFEGQKEEYYWEGKFIQQTLSTGGTSTTPWPRKGQLRITK